ncbi:arylsulfatase [Singulisphaera acidiphila]|uniref:Arylsulfatase A family protein n=1 Tax=Singulisphaera acidiphila (strain ATCC BAA-1392 / DSM 18658 / VKM B-2454 / MOB10) TaxID=886293 RepID=L0DDX7_SINAD|nr:sulfatase-like hydrolase/transferase [Singulisphaera acidiphila]AGA27070.1 arylsulfatase A family protein [Singulisphaera acidiphila DSM 18658]
MSKTLKLSTGLIVALGVWSAGSGLRATRTKAEDLVPQKRLDAERDVRFPVLPPPPEPFRGKINLRAKDSTPDFPQPIQAPSGAPNILLVLLDDVGFGASSTFGGPCPTPTLEALAKRGLRYNQFHTTALCSPTRAALITGRNHHSTHTACIMEAGTGYPGYDTVMGKDTATVAELLKQNGWNTAWFGKNHNVPDWQSSQNGPFDLWPTGLGFEHFYGFVGGDTSQWRPATIEGTKPIEPYLGNPDYHFDDDIANQAIKWIRSQKAISPDKPFFAYYAPGATHAPHHAREEWVAKAKGKFDQGWDKVREETFARQKALGVIPAEAKLTPRPDGIPAWDSLTADQKRVYARMMELYAAYLEQTDHNIGRVVEAIEQTGQLDNTLVFYIVGDNGASAEGSMQGLLNEMTFFNHVPENLKDVLRRVDDLGTWKTYNHYPAGWAHAMCTPFQWTKQVASHYGGTRNGMVVSWPKRIKEQGGLRSQWHHVIDIVPTILDVVRVATPATVNGVAQKPIEGVSMAYTFDNANAPSRRTTQYFEMLGNRAIYHDGWVACTTPPIPPWDPNSADIDPITGYRWELYHVANDFTQADDLANKLPNRLKDLQLLFYTEAAKYNVLPIDNSRTGRMDPAGRPSLTRGRSSFTFYDGMSRIPEGAAPDIKNKSFAIAAEVDVPNNEGAGMIVTQGGLFGGYALYLEKGKPVFHYNFVDVAHTEVAGQQALSPGQHSIRLDFRYDGGGIAKGGEATLSVDGKTVGQGRIERTIPVRLTLDEGLDIGLDTGTPVNLSYDVPFKFTGKIQKVTIDLK